MQYGISQSVAANTGTVNVKWHGGTGLFSVVPNDSFNATKITLKHDVSASGSADNYQSLGVDAEFTDTGQVIFTTASNSLQVKIEGGSSETYNILVKPVNERSAY
jgi:hypothetical protein|tara:strand:+ start:54 stop:368 length:315 start_codon:yes stop_codon:yes gene_type:complete